MIFRFKTLLLLLCLILSASSIKGQILIISADKYSDAIKPYIEWKNQKGMWTEVVTMSEIGSTANDIADFVKEFHKNSNNRYLLLVGDADDVPTHISYGITNPTAYSAYSDAEYGYIYSTDYPPAVLVGRFSGENADDIATQVERTIYYERDIDESATWLSSAVGIADQYSYETGDNGETDYQHITAINNRLKGYGYITNFTATKSTLKSLLNSGCGIVNYIGHGYTESWATTGFSGDDANELTNKNRLPIIFAAGCQNGHFRLSTCLAESFLRAETSDGTPVGAIGMLAFTTQIYWNPPMLAQDEFISILLDNSDNSPKYFGEVINSAYNEVIDVYKGSGLDVACQLALFGDPSLMLRTKAPSPMVIEHPDIIDIGNDTFTVSCNTDNALVSLWNNGNIVDTCRVENNIAEIDISALNEGETPTLTITAQDCISYQKEITVTDINGIKEDKSSSEFKIFPNPSNGTVSVQGFNDSVDIEIIDKNGATINFVTIAPDLPFKVSDTAGVYFIRILNDNSLHKVIVE